ncbi:hypothetical protein GPA19_09645 [Azoarcus indigens]|uniref:Coenzyme F420-reducing hydrogenase alpha subunit n=1 Tax=Azoarcus indigens TaxID=29545 RepID=A0A4V3BM83_9RHOO|nr:hypothetical protein [Azoarcus indigens]NMG65209.1 hypothetical protein [Azoarcus indigens]TDN49532.1 hypothetical protein C7389_11110 [Azoarcus indigens]
MNTQADPLLLHAHRQGSQLTHIDIRNQRPRAAALLAGRSPAEAAALVPRLFALCAQAQQSAARLACAAALGQPTPGEDEAAALERCLAAEAAQEHLWRLLLDWPPLLGFDARRNRYAELHRRLARPLSAEEAYALGGDLLDLVARELLAGFFTRLREPRNLGEFVDRAEAGGGLGSVLGALVRSGTAGAPASGAVALLPRRSAAGWLDALGGLPDEDWCLQPIDHGAAAETGPLARNAGSPLVRLLLEQGHRISARLLAKVIDVADCASRLRQPLAAGVPELADAASPAPGVGLAWVETARGLLLHGVRLDGEGRIADYRVCAPTEWNFHPAGSFASEGSGWPAPDSGIAQKRLNALALALDPCVAYRVILDDADPTEDAATGAGHA